MAFPVRYSTRAYYEYEEIIEYVYHKFGSDVAFRVDSYFEEVIDQITINPFLFPASDKIRNLRKCVISPQTIMYYRFNGEYIEIVSFRGTRMNPETLNP